MTTTAKAPPGPVLYSTGTPAAGPGSAHTPPTTPFWQRQTFKPATPGSASGGTPIQEQPAKTNTTPGPADAKVANADAYSGLPMDQRNAYLGLKNQLDQFGLGGLANSLLTYIQQGYSSDGLAYLLAQTPEYKQRFSGNAVRVKNGLPALSPSEYIATEAAYRQVLAAANLPKSFYDQPSDYANLIGSDISPDELKTRADHAFKYTQMTDPSVRNALKTYYGIDDQHIAAYFLDPNKAQNLLDKQALAAEIGGAAAQQGLNVDKAKAESYYDLGVSADQARTGAQNAALVAPETTTLGLRFNQPYTANDATDEFIGNLASARRKREQLNASETALFNGDTQIGRGNGVDSSGAY